ERAMGYIGVLCFSGSLRCYTGNPAVVSIKLQHILRRREHFDISRNTQIVLIDSYMGTLMAPSVPDHHHLFSSGKTSQRFVFVKVKLSWSDAQEHHTDLLSVRNPTENQEVQSMVPAGTLAWIGLLGDSWRWSDGGHSLYRYQWQGLVDNLGGGPNFILKQKCQ
uniref:C-type lectin domain-containing protein n=1 Tax=Sparus aurata TaxID=8175 RepID=A0A671XDT2_SPAAU